MTTALACLLCAGVTLYLTACDRAGETLVFFAAIGGMAVGAQRFAKEVSLAKRRKAALAVAVSFLFVVLAGTQLMDASAATSRYAFVFMVYFYPVMLAISLVVLARRILMLRGRPDRIEWADPYATGGFLAESSDPPRVRAAVAMGYTLWLVAGCLIGGAHTLAEAADTLHNTPEQAVTRQYAELCLARDCGVAPEQLTDTALTLTPEEDWGGFRDLYSYAFTWQGEDGAESRCYSLVFYDDFTCELMGQGADLDASLDDAQSTPAWTTPKTSWPGGRPASRRSKPKGYSPRCTTKRKSSPCSDRPKASAPPRGGRSSPSTGAAAAARAPWPPAWLPGGTAPSFAPTTSFSGRPSAPPPAWPSRGAISTGSAFTPRPCAPCWTARWPSTAPTTATAAG